MQFLIPLVFLLLQIVDAKHLNERSADEIHKCEYNGVTYNEGEPLPTHHMCLDCICTKDFTEPNDRECQVIKCPVTNHLEMGCLPVYNDTQCCPGSWKCKSAEEIAKCDDRYFKHYKVKNCIPKFEDNSDCPVRFSCPKDQETTVYQNECEYHGRLYKLGEDIPTSNPCEICSCRQDLATGNDISCIHMECPSVFRPQLNNSCYEVNELDKCCSVGTICDKENNQPEQNKVTCDYGGKTYYEGEKIYPKENPCLICLCTESWTGILGNSCRVHDCNLEIRRRQLQQGCLPIYHESTCCPIEFFCGTPSENYVNTTVPYANNDDIESGNSCTFKGDHYKVGQVLDIRHPTNCVTCTCTTPPDFTCIHKQCPGPPNEDYTNCFPTYSPGQCCPTYDCRPGTAHSAPQCSPVQCPSGCSEVTVDNSCPFCKCEERLCSPPKCPAGCEVEKDGPADRCPGCVCPDNIKVETKCGTEDISCPGFCVTVKDPFGCPLCMCGALCSPPKCGPGCELKRDVGKGECPRCACPDVPVSLQCSPVKCPPMCREIISSSGCPSCECQPLCSPPKCNAGCHVQPPKTPLSCPECVCDDQESDIKGKAQCAPVKCGPLCHEAFDGNGCPTCICDLACSPAKCGEECHLDYDPVISPCPVCVCDAVSADSQCPNMTCGSMCHTKMGSDGCPTCVCDPLCSAPKCGDGCHLEYDRSAGPCPACVCLATSGLHCSPVKCEAGCVEAIGESGCPTCVCNPQCAPVKCDIGCEVHYNPIIDLCPSCKCDITDEVNPIFPCSPPKCEEGCTVDYTAYPCPVCACDDASKDLSAVLCSPLKCSTGCKIDYSTKPCPSCSCPRRRFYSPSRRVQCSPPKCDLGCRINYNAKPCPSCDCSENPLFCSPPKCNPGCWIDAEAKPCPTCVCNTEKTESSGIPDIMCSPPLCDAGCRIDFTTKPCPTCTCDSVFTGVQCSPPKCGASCPIDYSTKPCPSCSCGGGSSLQTVVSSIQCSPPKCDSGCQIDYSTKPCPSCSCSNSGIPTLQCSQPKCDAGCQIDYNTKPCPSCSCGNQVSSIQCSPPKCDPGCQIDYSTKPCPSCSCSNSGFIPMIQCSPPKCEIGCIIDFSSKPCPTCSCNKDFIGVPTIQCSPPKCDPGCQLNYSTKPCPSCSCDEQDLPSLQCSPPKCEPGCSIDYTTKPCPSCYCEPQCSIPKCAPGCRLDFNSNRCAVCVCDRYQRKFATMPFNVFRDPFCATLSCGPGCERARTLSSPNQRCPMCTCRGATGEGTKSCAAMRCELPCQWKRFNEHACPSCICSTSPF